MEKIRKASFSASRFLEFREVQSQKGCLGMITLNRPSVLNSLNLEMVEGIARQLALWEQDPEIALVVLHSESERAFCAGGDVKTIALKLLEARANRYPAEFFQWEYKMDYMIHTYSKPILCWGDGIVMGGGMGIFCGSSHRVCTERSTFAMPEITIGFFPDVGAGYFLNQLPPGIGLFLGWTAARLTAPDALRLQLANFHISSANKMSVWTEMQKQNWSGTETQKRTQLSNLLKGFVEKPEPSHLFEFENSIQTIFTQAGPVQIQASFLAANERDEWWQASRKTFEKGSPLSAHITFEHQKRSRGKSILEVFVDEWSLARRFCENKDFPEGVRALLIDKDHVPRWQTPQFESVNQSLIESHLKPYPGMSEMKEFFKAPLSP